MSVLAVMCATGTSAAGVMLDRVVAVVNNEAITWGELYRAMEFELSRNMRKVSDEEKRKIFNENEAAFLESMIEVRLQLQEAERLGIKAGEKDVKAAIDNIKVKYALEEEEFLRVIREEGFTHEKYMEMLREQITIRKLIEREIRNRIQITEDDVRNYMKENNLREGVLYRLRQIFFSLPEDEEQEDALSGKIDAIRIKLKEGEDFALLAARYSEDPAARSTGGDLGLIEKENLSEEFVSALERLEPGQVSGPFQTSQGMHFLKLEEKKDARQAIFEMRFEEKFTNWLKGLRSRSFIDIRL
jgi:peptidyl-prolyl cis-trans isomerase SurA